MQDVKHLDTNNVSYILGLIRDIVNQPSILDDTNLQTTSTFSSVKIDNLLTTLKNDLQNDYRSLITNLNRLKKSVVTTLPTTDIDLDTLYMLKKTDANNNDYFEQYLYLNSTWELIATTNVADSKGIEIYDTNKQYVIDDVVLYKGTTDTYYSIYICKNATTGTFIDADWEIIDEQQKFVSISATQPSDTNLFWVDTTDPTKPLLKFHDGTAWVTISSSGGSSGISQYANYNALPLASSGSTSTDLVNNKFVFCNDDYTDASTKVKYPKGFYKYSSLTDSWSVVYKFDFDEGLRQLKNYIIETNLRTYTGEELDYGEFVLSSDASGNTGVILPLSKSQGSLELDSNGYIILNPNRTYEVSITATSNGRSDIGIYDSDGNTVDNKIFITGSTLGASFNWIIKTDDNSKSIYFKIVSGNTTGVIYSIHTNIIVRETNRQVIISATEIAEENQGIEAVPIGDIRDFLGTQVPTHYLFADGQEYNIADYPYLAQHILDNYGSINVFGGDGITTFAVPNKMDKANVIWYDITMTSNNTPSPYVVSTSSDYSSNYEGWYGINGNISNTWENIKGSIGPEWWMIDMGDKKYVSTIKMYRPAYGFKDFIVQGSYDGVTFTDIKTFSDTSTNTWKEYNLGGIYNYRYYRFYITTSLYSSWFVAQVGDMKFGLADVKLIKAEPSYYISEVGDTIAPNPSNTSTDYRLDITHKDGTVTTTDNLRGADGVMVQDAGMFGIRVENGQLMLYVNVPDSSSTDVDDQAPPFSIENNCLMYTVGGTIQYVSKQVIS